MNMRAARLYGKNDLRVEDIPVPAIEDDEILVRVKAAALCGTDYRMYLNGASGVDENNPLVLCHEFAGIIENAGSRVRTYEAGQRVSIAPNIGCGICDFCVSGNSHNCTSLVALGVHMDGGFAEFVKIPVSAVRLGNVSVLDDNVSFEAAAANEAFACAYNAYERYNVFPGDVVLIIGAGAIGLMHAKLAKMSGASKIILNDISESRLDECKKLEPSLITVKDNLLERLMKETDGKGANVVITACSVASVQQEALLYAAVDGRVNFFGGLPKGKEKVELDTNIIHYKQLIVTGTTRSSLWHYRKTLGFIASGVVDIDPLITNRYKINDIKTALDNLANAVGLKHMVVF
jgi:L-iditol 2-dehydrogenase